MHFIFPVLLIVIPAYLIGSTNGAIITSKLFYRKDIRDYGSGNPGLTNFYRTFGKGGALLVVLIDTLKTVIPVLFGGWLLEHSNVVPSFVIYDDFSAGFAFEGYFNRVLFGQLVAGFFVILGHCFPVLYKFKGGKGVMAIGTVVIVLNWQVALIGWGVFILVTLITRYVSLGSILGSTAFAFAMYFLNIGGLLELIVASMCVLLVVCRHAPNVKRMIKGEESRLSFRRNKE